MLIQTTGNHWFSNLVGHSYRKPVKENPNNSACRHHRKSQSTQRRQKEEATCGQCLWQVWWRRSRWAASQKEAGAAGLWRWQEPRSGWSWPVQHKGRQLRGEAQTHQEPDREDSDSKARAFRLPARLVHGWHGEELCVLHVNTSFQCSFSHYLFSFLDVNGATCAAVDQ